MLDHLPIVLQLNSKTVFTYFVEFIFSKLLISNIIDRELLMSHMLKRTMCCVVQNETNDDRPRKVCLCEYPELIIHDHHI